MTVRPPVTQRRAGWLPAVLPAARRLAVASCVGAVLGLLVGGVGGRLFMGLLADLNREDHGVITSDGFPMGEVTLSGTLNLFLIGTVLGVLGAGIHVGLRGLTLGPPWFRWLSTVVGGTVMVGATMVHEDGPDFTLLEPTWAAIGLSLAVPCLFLMVMAPLVDGATREGSWLMCSPAAWVGLAPWVFPLFFLVPVFALGWWLTRLAAAHRDARRVGAWAARGALVAVFIGGAIELGTEIAAIYETVGRGRYLLD